MNSDTLLQMVQKGYRISLGAVATLVETLQDPQQRFQSFSNLSEQWSELSEEWAIKGETTEQEARRFVDSLIAQRMTPPYSSPNTPSTVDVRASTPDTTNSSPAVQGELQELTAQIAALRAEVERLRAEG